MTEDTSQSELHLFPSVAPATAGKQMSSADAVISRMLLDTKSCRKAALLLTAKSGAKTQPICTVY